MKIFTGKVVSKKMAKTATVAVSNTITHRLYGKKYMRTKKYHVHDESDSKVGDVVSFTASRPYSKLIKWAMLKIESKKGQLPKNSGVKSGKIVKNEKVIKVQRKEKKS